MWNFFKKKEKENANGNYSLSPTINKDVDDEQALIDLIVDKIPKVKISVNEDKPSQLLSFSEEITQTEGYCTIDLIHKTKSNNLKTEIIKQRYDSVEINLVSLIIMADESSTCEFFSVKDEVTTAITMKKMSLEFTSFAFKTFWAPLEELLADYSEKTDLMEKLRIESAVREILILAFNDFFTFYQAKEKGLVKDNLLSPTELIAKEAIEKYKESEIGLTIEKVKEELEGIENEK